jgi:hypothetical protein
MGFLDALFGRTKQAQPNLDALFAVPAAALTLESAAEITPTGAGAVCFRDMEGGPFARIKEEVTALLGGSAPEEVRDGYGYTWLVIQRTGGDVVPALVTDLHAVNSTLEGEGFGPSLLCSTIGFRTASGQPMALVYLYKRGTFYPFAPLPGGAQRRDSALELQVRAMLEEDIKVESDLSRWFPVWGAPGL